MQIAGVRGLLAACASMVTHPGKCFFLTISPAKASYSYFPAYVHSSTCHPNFVNLGNLRFSILPGPHSRVTKQVDVSLDNCELWRPTCLRCHEMTGGPQAQCINVNSGPCLVACHQTRCTYSSTTLGSWKCPQTRTHPPCCKCAAGNRAPVSPWTRKPAWCHGTAAAQKITARCESIASRSVPTRITESITGLLNTIPLGEKHSQSTGQRQDL